MEKSRWSGYLKGSSLSEFDGAPSIKVTSVSKVYPGGKKALTDVSFEVESGSFVVLLGPSGSGKSTLIRCIAGLERVSEGKIQFDSKTVSSKDLHIKSEERELSMVFQDYALWPHMTALDNVAFALRRRSLPKSQRKTLATSMLDRMGLMHLADRYPQELSGGEQQRVALARALVARPGLMLFDEPLSNLDADLRERLRVEISTLTREVGATALYITHDQSEAFALADYVGVLDRGRLVQLDRPEELYAKPKTPFVARFTGLAGDLPAVVDSVDLSRHVVSTLDGCAWLSASSNVTLQKGEKVRMLIRAAAVKMAALAVSGVNPQRGTLSGTVSDVAFRGIGYEHVVEVSDGYRLSGIFSDLRHSRGTGVLLSFDPEGCILFPEKSEGASSVTLDNQSLKTDETRLEVSPSLP